MNDSHARRIQALEMRVRKQQVLIDHLQRRNEALTVELKATQHQLQEERAQHALTKQRLAELIHAIEHADQRYRNMLRREYGASSERLLGNQELLSACLEELDPDQRDEITALEQARQQASELVTDMEELSTSSDSSPDKTKAADDNAVDEEEEAETVYVPRRRPPGTGGRKELPADLPCRQIFYVPPDDHPYFANVKASKELGRRIIKRLSLEPLRAVVHDISAPRMRLELKNGIKTIRTMAPPSILGVGQADDTVLIHSACDKVLDHLPSYRQSKRFQRIGLPLARSKLCRWHIAIGEFLEPIAEAILHEITDQAVIGIDDTIHRLIDAELHRCKNGRLWAVAGARDVFYFFSETREGKWIESLLTDYQGAIMGDAYSGHNVLLKREHILALFCWAHVRRKFFEATDDLKRKQALHIIGQLYAIEDTISELPPDEKVASRERAAQPLLAQFKQLLDAWQADQHVLPKSDIGRATNYALGLWDGLCAYVSIGEAPMDNNHTERAMRPNALHRKNSLFSASVRGAEAYATLSTVIQSACLHGLNPEKYLIDIIDVMHFNRLTPSELTPAQYALRIGDKEPVKDPS